MSKENIRLLKEEIENLRKENSHLRTALKVKEMEGENGQSVISREKLDSTVKALVKQLDELKEFHSLIGKTLERSKKVEESMEALAPALEVQVRGYQREIDHLHASSEDTAETYAGIVANLENQLKEKEESHQKEMEKIKAEYEAKVKALEEKTGLLQQKVDDFESKKSVTNDKATDNNVGAQPFTSLSIFTE
ncbi:MAG: hypothetical protein KDD99_07655 [Bacteroidetes bacterium]|nr:hypothetical protein [Bacteroidota bacterium]